MKHLFLLSAIICGLNCLPLKGVPTLSFNSSGTSESLPDPDESREIPKISLGEAEAILDDFGYVATDDIGTRSSLGGSGQILSFQRDFGLLETGTLDEETLLALESPRCGVRSADKTDSGVLYKWPKSRLTYAIINYPARKSSDTIRSLIQQAFNEWSKVTNLDFVEVASSSLADIRVGFGGIDHKQGIKSCSFPSSRTLAHAFFPQTGDVHFNTRYFFEGGKSLREFLDTALHEIGHALGLEHINSEASLMHPSANNQFTKPQPIDVMNIQALYGVRKSNYYGTIPTFCQLSKIDAIFKDGSGNRYAFAGDYFYDASSNSKGQLISSKWPGLPGNIDAAFQYGNGRTYFFKGDRYYRFKGNKKEYTGSSSIRSGFPGLPTSIDAAIVDADGDVFVFKGSQYWIYFSTMKRANGPWWTTMVPKNVDAVYMTRDGRLISYKGANFYVWNSNGLSNPKQICY